jgi:drug/metabolite transporter (DMT)-like permease
MQNTIEKLTRINQARALNGSAYLTLFGAQLAIGAAGIFARYALQGAGPLMTSALRLTIASAFVLLLNARMKEKAKIDQRHEILFAICGVALAMHFGTWVASLQFTTVAIATLLVSTSPIWTALYDVVVLNHKPTKMFWIGFLAAIVGAIVIVSSQGSSTHHQIAHLSSQDWLGEMLAIAGGIAFAVYLIAIRSVSQRYSTLAIVTRTYTWAAVSLWFAALAAREGLPSWDLKCWVGILGMAFISQLLGHTGINAALKKFRSSVVALSTLLEPVFAAVLAIPFFGETLTIQMVAGSILLLAGLALVLKAQPPEKEEEVSLGTPEL